MTKRVAIIGAGVSGLPAARWAIAYGWEPVVFEQESDLGGLWCYKEESKGATTMKSTVINTPKEMIAYSDFPFPSDESNFMHHTRVLSYLRSYAAAHGIAKHIRFNCYVLNVHRADDYELTGRWKINFIESGNKKTETFDAVLSCVGHHSKPHIPQWPDMETFNGSIIHSKVYRESRNFEDKRVLVIGAGNSGIDVACDLSRVARQVFLSTRGGVWVMPRTLPTGWPTSMWLNCQWNEYIRRWLPKCVWSWMLVKQLQRAFNHDSYGLRPAGSPVDEHFSISDELPIRLSTGQIRIKPEVKKFTKNGVFFANEAIPTPVDTVILATGYNFGFPFLDDGNLIPIKGNHVRLYKNMWPTGGAPWNTLAVIGLVYPVGPVPPISEMQARLFFAVASSAVQLPSKPKMEMEIDAAELNRSHTDAQRHNINVNYIEYMDMLAEMINVCPRPFDYIFSDPLLTYQLIFGPKVSYSYRLSGPHSWAPARDTIMTVGERSLAGLNGKRALPSKSKKSKLLLEYVSKLSVFFVVISCLIFSKVY